MWCLQLCTCLPAYNFLEVAQRGTRRELWRGNQPDLSEVWFVLFKGSFLLLSDHTLQRCGNHLHFKCRRKTVTQTNATVMMMTFDDFFNSHYSKTPKIMLHKIRYGFKGFLHEWVEYMKSLFMLDFGELWTATVSRFLPLPSLYPSNKTCLCL